MSTGIVLLLRSQCESGSHVDYFPQNYSRDLPASLQILCICHIFWKALNVCVAYHMSRRAPKSDEVISHFAPRMIKYHGVPIRHRKNLCAGFDKEPISVRELAPRRRWDTKDHSSLEQRIRKVRRTNEAIWMTRTTENVRNLLSNLSMILASRILCSRMNAYADAPDCAEWRTACSHINLPSSVRISQL